MIEAELHMPTMMKILDKLLTSLITSCLLFFVSFSFITGKFPPQKADMKKAFTLIQQMLSTTQEHNAYAKGLEGQPPNLEQIIHLQRLALQRSEVTLELTKIMARFPNGVPSLAIADKLNEASLHLAKSDEALTSVNQDIQKMSTTTTGEP
ncbi:MAG: hypothetical protein ACXWC9_01195 [Pseudobdellovibrionaceae bacterium]